MLAPQCKRVTNEAAGKNTKQIIEKCPDARAALVIFAAYSLQLPLLTGASSYFGFANECAIRTDSSSHPVGPVPPEFMSSVSTMFVKQG